MSEDPMKNYFLYLSAFQKCVRRGMEKEAYKFASKIEDVNPKSLWNRIKIITSEDVGVNPVIVSAIDTLDKWYWEQIRAGNSGGRLHLLNAILILCRMPKCRDCDNLLISTDIKMMLRKEDMGIPDFAFDKHTAEGRKMGRGYDHFFEVGTKCDNDISNPIYKEEAKELLIKEGSPVKWKMDKLAKFKGKGKDNPQSSLDDCF